MSDEQPGLEPEARAGDRWGDPISEDYIVYESSKKIIRRVNPSED
jgi:hypothetical protein